MTRTRIAVLSFLPLSLSAQWLDFKTPGIPRTPDGKPNLTAPVPRTADGHPDLSGLWQPQPNNWFHDVVPQFNDDGVFRPEAEAVYQDRIAGGDRDSPDVRCLPRGPVEIFGTPDTSAAYRIIQSPTVIGVLFESGPYRQIFLDGRELPKDPNPTWMGYSIGRWDGDTLVVETAGFNDAGWLDPVGHPRSEKLHVTEKFRRVDFGHMQFQITFDDPVNLIKPLTISLGMNYAADTSMIENVCNENERDSVHMTSRARPKVEISPAILAKYAGTYKFAGDNPARAAYFGRTVTVTLFSGRLSVNSLPVVPQSKTYFVSAEVNVQFLLDPSGTPTQLVFRLSGLDVRYDREP